MHYPVFLDLRSRPVLVVGGGKGAFAKVPSLPEAGGAVTRGGVRVAVSTDGGAPALAGLLREALERVLPEELSEWTRVGQEVRARWKRAGVPIGERRPLLLEALNDIYRRPA